MIYHEKGNILTSKANIIVNPVNNQGRANTILMEQIKEQYPECFYEYKEECDIHCIFGVPAIGLIQYTKTKDNLIIANMFVEKQIGNKFCIDYSALTICLLQLRKKQRNEQLSIAMYCGNANFDRFENLINHVFENEEQSLTLYRDL